MKKVLMFTLTVAMLLSLTTVAFAEEDSDDLFYYYVDSYDLIDWDLVTDNTVVIMPINGFSVKSDEIVSPEDPITKPQNTSAPDYFSEVWDISEDGTYSYKGAVYESDYLYTNYFFKGCESYRITFTNTGNTATTMSIVGFFKVYHTVDIPAGSYGFTTFKTTNSYTVDVDTKFCLKWTMPCSVEGEVMAY
jgi:hypothetical protein